MVTTVSHQLTDSADSELALPSVTIEEPAQAARAAGLRYVCDDCPGIQRRRRGKAFTYLDLAGDRISDSAELKRFSSLVIFPAWENVWICPFPNGHLPRCQRSQAVPLSCRLAHNPQPEQV